MRRTRTENLLIIFADVFTEMCGAILFLAVYPMLCAAFLVACVTMAVGVEIVTVARLKWLAFGIAAPVSWLDHLRRGPPPDSP